MIQTNDNITKLNNKTTNIIIIPNKILSKFKNITNTYIILGRNKTCYFVLKLFDI